MPVSEQPMRKLLGVLYPTISWLSEQGSVAISAVPTDHLEAIKQLERIGIVYKRNNRSYELQKIRLKKLLGNENLQDLITQVTPTIQEVLNTQETLDCSPKSIVNPEIKATLN
jgi:hypothetical protein